MALLKNPHQTPPDGFVYLQRETGLRIERDTLAECEDSVIAHREHKGLSPTDRPSVSLDIQRQICSGQFPGVCRPEPGEDYRPLRDLSRDLDTEKVMAFSRAAFAFLGSGGEIVDKTESARRAEICRGCRFNRASTCTCTPVYRMIDALVPAGRRESGLLICGICGCSNQVKTLMPKEVIEKSDAGRNLVYPDHCWIRAR